MFWTKHSRYLNNKIIIKRKWVFAKKITKYSWYCDRKKITEGIWIVGPARIFLCQMSTVFVIFIYQISIFVYFVSVKITSFFCLFFSNIDCFLLFFLKISIFSRIFKKNPPELLVALVPRLAAVLTPFGRRVDSHQKDGTLKSTIGFSWKLGPEMGCLLFWKLIFLATTTTSNRYYILTKKKTKQNARNSIFYHKK